MTKSQKKTYELSDLTSYYEEASTRMELHITWANYQAKIWVQANHAIIDLENKTTETIGCWTKSSLEALVSNSTHVYAAT